jgi:peptidoglycan/xylan/chitin deacetylase (PgdA/CDA1 family)
MKAIMYHYIRDKNNLFPYIKALKKRSYIRQIHSFKKIGLVNSYVDLFSNSNKFFPTFDDGYKDHIFAAEVLKKNNCFGGFFIPTSPIKNNKILDVHKVHLILGKIKAKEALNEVEKYLIKKKIKYFSSSADKYKYNSAYRQFNDDFYCKKFKKIFNYYGNLKVKSKILDYLLKKFDINIKPSDFYLNKKEIKYIAQLGMLIGSHGESHTLLSRLSYNQQYKEIKDSKLFLEKIVDKNIDIFCYPYGGNISYNNNTLKILKKLKFKISFSIGNKDICDMLKEPYKLPRYDCNLF